MLKEVSYKDLKFNPFRLIGDEWMLVTAGNEKDGCNTMTASWGGIGCLWGQKGHRDRYLDSLFRVDEPVPRDFNINM